MNAKLQIPLWRCPICLFKGSSFKVVDGHGPASRSLTQLPLLATDLFTPRSALLRRLLGFNVPPLNMPRVAQVKLQNLFNHSLEA
jgi:hypothetical protein